MYTYVVRVVGFFCKAYRGMIILVGGGGGLCIGGMVSVYVLMYTYVYNTADAFSFIRSYFALSFPSELSR